MHEEDLKQLKQAEEILETEIRNETKKIIDAGQFAPGQTKTLSEAVCLMLKMKEYEEWLNGMGMSEYSQRNYARNNQQSNGYSYRMPHYSYNRGYSGHSTKDRMIACLEDLMGEVHNEYEAQMISDVIANIQNSRY